MYVNPDKCDVLRVTNKRKHRIQIQYKIRGRVLDTVDKTKYIGVNIQSKLNLEAPCKQYNQGCQQCQGVLTEKPIQLTPYFPKNNYIRLMCA